ncbi:MAG: hypothetical protein NT038_03575 [Euryarchaeota archaeon]|nr:hypothetical protein [Euryarchaeota archaeon]
MRIDINKKFLDDCRKKALKIFDERLKSVCKDLNSDVIEDIEESGYDGFDDIVESIDEHHTEEWVDENIGILEGYNDILDKEFWQPIREKILKIDFYSLLKNDKVK